ncbi:MAG: sugar phosphate isomerase/epimerase [Victivallales bacterium]|nr:sugar phosphate isomerase/epimerase [Victivallales bacterium]
MHSSISQLVLSNLSMQDFFSQVKDAGYEAVELSLQPKNPSFNYNTTDADLKAFKALSDEKGLPIESITIANSKGNLVLAPADAKECIDETAWALECAAKLGATAALHTLGRFTPDLYYEDAYKNAVANLKTLAPICEKLNVALSVEFVWSGFLFSPLEMRNFLNEVGSSHVGFYFDPGNMAVFQYPQHWVRALGKLVKRVHMKDWKGGPLNGQWTRLGEGACDFKAIMCELKKAGYDGPLVSEVSPSLASLKDTADDIKSIIARFA